MQSDQFAVVLCQMTSVDNIDVNKATIVSLLENIARNERVNLICFPENCLYFRIRDGEPIPAFTLEESFFKDFMFYARQLNAWLHFGSVAVMFQQKTYNVSVIVSPQGEIFASYKKIHLFDVDIDDKQLIRESDLFTPGETPTIFDCDGWRLGQSICYDIRFPELFVSYAKAEVDALLVPAAFLRVTGESHWETLLKARAIETQSYVIAAAQCGVHNSVKFNACTKLSYGHSMVVDPWGKILAVAGDEQVILRVTLDRSYIRKVRKQIPIKAHRLKAPL